MIVLHGNPISTQHAYGQHGKIRYMKKEAKDRKEQYQWEAKSQWRGRAIKEPLSVRVILYFGDKRKHDIDNFSKLLFDALTGIVWDDDSQIQSACFEKRYCKENPRIEIEIHEQAQRPGETPGNL